MRLPNSTTSKFGIACESKVRANHTMLRLSRSSLSSRPGREPSRRQNAARKRFRGRVTTSLDDRLPEILALVHIRTRFPLLGCPSSALSVSEGARSLSDLT